MWLQVMNPEFFDGVWSLAPDPIDFHYFQTADLYEEGGNVLFDADNKPRPIARNGEHPVLFAPTFVSMDDTIRDGGQMGSFEWAFSPKGDDGRPLHMFDRETGEVDPSVVAYWERYDIRKVLEARWDELSPKLSGKINIVAGGLDTFYLEDAAIAMGEFFNSKDFDATVRVIEGGDHGAVFRTSMIVEMDNWIADRLNLVNNQVAVQGPEPSTP